MKRCLRFRAEAIHNGEWVYGLPVHYNRDYRYEKWTIRDDEGLETDIEEETLCQFTGLHDMHETEIYEGDLVWIYRTPVKKRKSVPVLHEVSCSNAFNWSFIPLRTDIIPLHLMNHTDWDSFKFEVVGTIYDKNKE